MKNSVQNDVFILLLAGTMVLTGGCTSGLTTSMVWRINQYHPAEISRLNLATVPQKSDVLVQYDECFAKSKTVRPRAFWLLEYAAKDTNCWHRPKPDFVNLAEFTNLCVVPLIQSQTKVLTNGYCALPATNQQSFVMWHDGVAMRNFSLPVYSNAPPVTWGRVMLTPVTAATDTAIVVLLVGACGLGAGAH